MTDAEKIRRAVEEDYYVGDVAPLLAKEVKRLTNERDMLEGKAQGMELAMATTSAAMDPESREQVLVLLPMLRDMFAAHQGKEIARLRRERDRLFNWAVGEIQMDRRPPVLFEEASVAAIEVMTTYPEPYFETQDALAAHDAKAMEEWR